MIQILSVLRAFALILKMFSAAMLVPVVVSWINQDGAERAYDDGLLISLGMALILWLVAHRDRRELQIKDGFLLVVMVWALLPAFAAIPLMDYFWPNLSFTDAYFETMSGVTTTGATVLTGLDKLPFSINLWRGELQWLGGMGIIVLAVAILPFLGVGGAQIFKWESPGPMKESKLTPRIAESAKSFWSVYVAMTLACILAMWLAGMTWGDAVLHAFAALATGGFSTHDASFGYFDSPAIEAVTILFMTLAAMNFGTHFLAWREKSLSPYRVDFEIGWFLLVMYGSILGLALFLWGMGTYEDFFTALRFTAFNVVSISTTTGFANTDFNLWPLFAPLWMLFMCSFVSCSGSTGGGIKMIRGIALYKQVFRELMRATHPASHRAIWIGGEALPNGIVFAVLAFGFIYMVIVASFTLALVATGLDLTTAFSAVVATINNTGPGLNQVGPATTFAVLTDTQTWICSIAMLLGRLEMFPVLVVLTPSFWFR
jgi:trk system potassium uptake protein